jgi:hypothetical protein
MKKLLFVTLMSITTVASALELRLQCSISSVTRLSGNVDREKGRATVEITDFDKPQLRAIIIDTGIDNAINSVSAGSMVNNRSNRISTADYSDKNKWDISTTLNGNQPTIAKVEARIMIDRSTGELISSRTIYFKSGVIMEHTASGPCEKINTAQKKF